MLGISPTLVANNTSIDKIIERLQMLKKVAEHKHFNPAAAGLMISAAREGVLPFDPLSATEEVLFSWLSSYTWDVREDKLVLLDPTNGQVAMSYDRKDDGDESTEIV